MPKPKLPDIDFDWTPNLAYVIGLIATDGNLSPDGRHLAIKSADKQLLQTFKNCLGIENKICKEKDKDCHRIQFGNVQFYRWLNRLGIQPTKRRQARNYVANKNCAP